MLAMFAKFFVTCTVAPRGVNSTILFVYRMGYVYGKVLEGFQKVFVSALSALDNTVKC